MGNPFVRYAQECMPQFLFKRILRVIAVLCSVTLVTFLLIHAIPGSPWSNYADARRALLMTSMDKSLRDNLNHHFGLDLPLWRQFTRYMIGDFDADGSFFCSAVCGDLGPSIQQRGRSVQDILFRPPEGKTFWESRFGYSIRLVLLGSLIAAFLGIPLGILSVTKPKGTSSRISVGLAALISIPNFVFALLTIIVLASWLKIMKILPDWNYPSSWIVPAIVLAIVPMASIARVTHASLLNILSMKITFARRGPRGCRKPE